MVNKQQVLIPIPRIKRSIHIHVNSVQFLSEKEIAGLRKGNLLTEYIDTRPAVVPEFGLPHRMPTGHDLRALAASL